METHTNVTSVQRDGGGYMVTTDSGEWRCRTVVLASGACNIARVPALDEAAPAGIARISAIDYRNPDQLDRGGVLMFGASATGTQLADEIQRSGRAVTISVGEHIRAPRLYRGRDLEWWMDAAGVLNERYDEVEDTQRARKLPSLQLAGTTDRSTLDLNSLAAIGVKHIDASPASTTARRNSPARWSINAPSPTSRWGASWTASTNGRAPTGLTARLARQSAWRRRRSRHRRRSAWIWAPARSRPSSGRPATAPIIHGSTLRCSTARAKSATTAGSSAMRPACISWAYNFCAAASLL
jgi:cation diffusion facilitator CzcD-associated flavoprotein CzcO